MYRIEGVGLTAGSAQTASPTMNGMMRYVLVLMARRVMFLTVAGSSCAFDMVGSRTLSMDVLMLFTMNCGNFCPWLNWARSDLVYILPMINCRSSLYTVSKTAEISSFHP